MRILSKPTTYAHSYGLPRVPYKQWDSESMEMAVAIVERGETSVRRAAEIYNVPRSTLHDRVSGKIRIDSKPGKKPYLSVEEEEELVSFFLKCAKIGYSHTRREALAIVQRILESKGIHPVGDGWWKRFCDRHPQLTLRVAMPLSKARALATDHDVISRYYNVLEDTLIANNLFNDPHCIYNYDETGFPLNLKPLKVLEAVGTKHPYHITGDTKSQITVLACTNAAGSTIPPFVIFDRKSLNPQMIKGEVPGSIYGLSSNGWITQELFCDWFTRHFLAYVPSTRPLLLLMDGHSSHYCPEVIRTAAAAQIILFTLPPHTTHLTQPLDKSAFSSLKVFWRHVCHDFIVQNPGRVVTHYDFCHLFSQAWFKAMTMKNIVSGFRVTGICPFDRKAIRIPEEYKSFKPESLPEKTGLAYIPLYSPAHGRTHFKVSSHNSILDCNSSPIVQPAEENRVSEDNISLTVRISSDSDDSSNRCSILPLRDSRTLSKFLRTPMPPSKLPTKHQKSCGKVLTSVENMHIMEAREHDKQQKEKLKEERRKAREEKLKNKQSKSGRGCL